MRTKTFLEQSIRIARSFLPSHSELSNPIEAQLPKEKPNEILIGRVTYILDKHPDTRDDKSLFFKTYEDQFGNFTHSFAETLSREWRLVQRKNEKLRGNKFYDRQAHSKKMARLYKS